jgi:hypothetical protein
MDSSGALLRISPERSSNASVKIVMNFLRARCVFLMIAWAMTANGVEAGPLNLLATTQ